jgi:8-oxo-dGTP pyrophosphatase MutT (NUDIX family)
MTLEPESESESQSESWTGSVADGGESRPIVQRAERFTGRVWSIVSDDVDFGATVATRDVQLHPGAVAIIAVDDRDRVLLIRQYRHPVGAYLFEPPGGLLDVLDEPAWRTAARELAEEAGYRAADWNVLADVYLSPGGSSEAIRLYLARSLDVLPGGRPRTNEAEEAHLPRAWVELDEARDLVLAGRIGSPSAAVGILAAWASRATGWAGLRPVDAPWPARDGLERQGRIAPIQRNPT